MPLEIVVLLSSSLFMIDGIDREILCSYRRGVMIHNIMILTATSVMYMYVCMAARLGSITESGSIRSRSYKVKGGKTAWININKPCICYWILS